MTKSVKLETKSKHRHGNCVPFILTNSKMGTITFKGSLNEVAEKLKISQPMASYSHRYDKSVTKGKSTYTITRMGFDTTLNIAHV